MAKPRKSAFHSASSQVPRLLSVQQAAGELGISRTLTYELMSAGQLRSVKVKRRRFIPRESIEQFIAQLPASSPGGGFGPALHAAGSGAVHSGRVEAGDA
jgi:excisionase family DNA binding protein